MVCKTVTDMNKKSSTIDGGVKMVNDWDKFCLLMWKNGLLQWRHKVQTTIEILMPVTFSLILVFIRILVEPQSFPDPTIYTPYSISTLEPLRNYSNREATPQINQWKLAYSPKCSLFDSLMENVVKSLTTLEGFVGADDPEELESILTKNLLVAGVQFEHFSNITELPKQLLYSLRFPSELRTEDTTLMQPLNFNWHTNRLYPLFARDGPRDDEDNDGGAPRYFREGFIPIQDAIARAFVKLKSNVDMPEILMQRFPYPPFTHDVLLQGLEIIVSIFILLSFIYPCINTVRFIAIEKEKQLKEAMKIMGLPNWLHWSGWFLRTMIFMVISISFTVVLLKVQMAHSAVSIFTKTDWTVLWTFLFVYIISMTTFCFMLSVFFSKANIAAAVAGLLWFILYVPFSFTQHNYESLSFATKLLVCLSSNTAMAYGIQLILRFEGTGEGLQWSNILRPVTIDDNLTVAMTMGLMLFSSCVYLLITLYVEKVMPGSYGVPEPWYFPFTKEFWFGPSEYKGLEGNNIHSDESSHDQSHNWLNFEADPRNRRAGVQVKKLRKVYSNKKVAVNGLSINMFDDQITVLLGHNGAGKTTTMSMLTGMFQPTLGTALINGFDIRSNISRARSSIGLCPQHNILFDELTVREHIMFYSRLKGLDEQAVEEEVIKYIKLLELKPKIDAMSSTLSGGMKRKLSVGVALCGRSKVVLCDEPSSGMDPAARRALWDLLQSEKKGRTILLSTHFMDEADVLGDRIAIMADGELKCCGTSFFLKKRFGTGYHLICVKDDDCNSNDLTHFLRRYLPGIKVETEIGSELSYQLPDEQVNIFENMFKDLEENHKSLKLGSFGVSHTTLEEVFLKVGSDSTESDTASDELTIQNSDCNRHNSCDNESNIGNSFKTSIASETLPLLRGLSLKRNQLYAMLKKRFIYWMRTRIMFLLQNLCPICFIIISVMVVRSLEKSTDLQPLEISLSSYEKSVTILQTNLDVDANSLAAKIVSEYQGNFKQESSTTKLTTITEDVIPYFLKLAKNSIVKLNSQYLAAASIGTHSNGTIIAWFNNQPFHVAPLSMNLVHNAIVRATIGQDHSIELVNAPLPFSFDSRLSILSAGTNMGFQLATNIGFAMAFVSSFYVLFYIKERVSKAKLLQFVSGVNVFTFWMTSLLWDFVTYIFTTVLIITTLVAFHEEGWATVEELGRAFIVLLLFGFAVLPMTLIASMFFSVPSGGFVRLTIFNILTGITILFVILAMSNEEYGLEDLADNFKWIFLAFPHYSLSSGLMNLNAATTLDRVCRTKCEILPLCNQDILCSIEPRCCDFSYYGWEEPGIARNLTYMSATGLVCLITLLIVEYNILEGIVYVVMSYFQRKLPFASEDGFIDADVDEEKRRVNNMTTDDLQSNNLVMQKVSKFYGKFLAVNQISIGIKQSECFGLLGVNGAGKTSTFKMLTGDERISSGEAWVRGISLKTDMNNVHKVIGYCPQFDALIEDLTGRETLEMFALLRGVPRSEINSLSIRLASELNFMKHIDKQVFEYSGGNKRKLSTAIALIGNPSVIYLDEPTTGMDPGAKRNLWNMVCKVRNSGKSIVLTSHSMEECEALCTRLAIMVNGEFKCLGSTQHLKNKFSKGFVLAIKVQKISEIDIDDKIGDNHLINEIQQKIVQIKHFILTSFPGAYLKEEYQGLLTYYVPPTDNIRWSSMFGLMEIGKKTLQIEDYSICQTSLEQVFLSFTKYQRE